MSENSTTTQPAPKTSRRGLWISIAAVIIIAAGLSGGGFYIQNQETAAIEQARAALDVAEWRTASDLANDVISTQPEFLRQHTAEAFGTRAVAEYYLGNIDQALADTTQALNLDDNLVDLYAYQAVMLFEQGDNSAAITASDNALANEALQPEHLLAQIYAYRALTADSPAEGAADAEAAFERIGYVPTDLWTDLFTIRAQTAEGTTALDAAKQVLNDSESQLSNEEQIALTTLLLDEAIANGDQAATLTISQRLLDFDLSAEQAAELYQIRADILRQQGELADAIDAYKLAAGGDDVAESLTLEAILAFDGRDYESALQLAENAIDLDAGQGDAQRIKGIILHWQLEQHAAAEALDKAIEANPEDTRALVIRALFTTNELWDNIGAREDAERVIELSPDTPDGLMAAAILSAINNDLEIAQQLLTAAIEIEPNRPEFFLFRYQMYRTFSTKDEELADIERFGELALDSGLYDFVYGSWDDNFNPKSVPGPEFKERYEQYPNYWGSYADYASVLTSEEEYEAAQEVIDEGIELFPDHTGILIRQIELYVATDEQELAYELLDALSAKDEETANNLLRSQAYIAFSEDDYERALSAIEKALERYPNSIGLNAFKAELLFAQNDIEAAYELLETQLLRDPNNGSMLLLRGFIFETQGNVTEAIADYTRVKDLYPNDAFTSVLQAGAYLQQGDLRSAKRSAEEALDLDEDTYDAHRILFVTAIQDEDLDEAAKQFELFNEKRRDDDTFSALVAADMALDLGEFETSIEISEASIEADPELSHAYSSLASAYLNLGEKEPGQAALRQVIATASDINVISEAERSLATSDSLGTLVDGRFEIVDENYGFKLSYPETWEQLPIDPESGQVFAAQLKDPDFIGSAQFFLFDDLPPGLTASDLAAAVGSNLSGVEGFKSISLTTVQVAGRTAMVREYELDLGFELLYGRQYYLVTNQGAYVITLETSVSDREIVGPDLDSIIESFELLD